MFGSDLKDSIKNLYLVFSKYPLKPKIEGCPHCALEKVESKLHTHKLESLSWEDLGVYPFKAMTTFGDLEDFKHFLPRIFELVAVDYWDSNYGIDLITANKLEYGNWRRWPKEEIEAVEGFFRALISGSKDPENFEKSGSNDEAFRVEEIVECMRILKIT